MNIHFLILLSFMIAVVVLVEQSACGVLEKRGTESVDQQKDPENAGKICATAEGNRSRLA